MHRTNGTAITNEQIIAALISNGTIKAAAAAVGVSSRTISDRMKNKDFRAEYAEAKNDILRQAVHSINGQLAAAIAVVAEIMTDKEATPATRLQAAQTIIKNSMQFISRLDIEETAARAIDDDLLDIF